MTKPMSLFRRSGCSIRGSVLFLALCGLTGCGGSGTGDNIRVPASERPDLEPQTTTGSIQVPDKEAFNIVAFRSGQEGSARGEATPLEKVGAELNATASDGGSAWGEFQLGYCFDNIGDKPLKGVVRIQLDVTELSTSLEAGEVDPAASNSTASVNLTAFIKSSAGIRVKEESLVASTLLKGPSSAKRPYDLVFDLNMQPMSGYYIVLSGRAEVQAQEGQSVSASLRVPKCSVEVRWSPAEAHRAAAAEPESAAPQPTGEDASDS